MKKILSLILLIISINGFSQTGFPGQQSMANASTRLIVNGGLQGVRGIINGVFTDTTAANSDFIDFYNGAQIYTRSDRNFWLRDSVLNMWIRMAKYSELGGSNRFGVSGEDDTPAQNRSVGFTSTYTMALRHLRSLTIDADSLNGAGIGYSFLNVTNFNNSTQLGTAYRMQGNVSLFQSEWNGGNTWAQIGTSADGSEFNYYRAYRDSLSIFLSAASPLKIHNLPSASSANALFYDPSTGDVTYDAAGGGSGEANTASNLAGDGVGIWKDKSGVDLRFKRLKAGDGIAITDMTDSVLITSVIDINNNDEWYPYKADMGNPSNAFLWKNNSGTGSSATTQGDIFLNWMNSLTYNTGTTSTGFAYTHHGNNGLVQPISIASTARYSIRFKLRLEDLSDGTETYRVWAGFADDHTNGNPVDAIMFTYTHSDSSGQWVCKNFSNSSVTAVASGVTVAADTDYILEVTAIGGIAYYYINKVLVATIGSNVPDDDLARATSINLVIRKSNGITPRKMYVEEVWYGRKSN